MERILSHPLLEASVRRREMFRYLIGETLAGRGDHLKGYSIALTVFGRDDSFDSQSDPIVRIEARRLRSDLDAYYAGPGRDDPLRIAVPKGGYVPQAYWQNRPPPPGPPVTDGAATALAQDAASSVPKARRAPVSRRIPVSTALLAAFAAVTVAVALVWLWAGRAERGSTVAVVASVQTVPLLVLPFVATDGGSESGLLAQGLTQELISDLMRFSGLRLFAANASFRQNAEADPTVLGTDLGVSYVVRGSVGAEGNALRVIADLVEVKTGQVLWSKTFDRQLTPGDVLAVQQSLAGEIAAVLGQSYGVVKTAVAGQGARSVSAGMESYLCVLQAQAYRRTFDASLHGPALSCLQDAIRRDPTYADAWAMLGFLQLDEVRYNLIPAAAAGETMAEASKAASKAIELDPEAVSGLQALAAIDYYSGRIDESEAVMRHALALNPNDPETLAQFGWRLSARGKFDEGIPLVEKAIDRTVRPPGWYFHSIAVHRYLQGDYAGAIDAAQRSAVNGSAVGWSIEAAAQASLGNMSEARQALMQMGEADPDMQRDPAAVLRTHQVIEPTVEALMTGLRKAGWSRP
jgi:TolB-like protein/Flp pilus assembly protein TadD